MGKPPKPIKPPPAQRFLVGLGRGSYTIRVSDKITASVGSQPTPPNAKFSITLGSGRYGIAGAPSTFEEIS